MASELSERITDEMKQIASTEAQWFMAQYGYTEEKFFKFFERLYLEALSENASPHLIKMYLVYLIGYDCIEGLCGNNASWNQIKKDINLSFAHTICETDEYVIRIPCRCGVGESHFFKSNNCYCDNNTLVYQTVSCVFLNGVHNINDEQSLVDTVKDFRYARPPLRFGYRRPFNQKFVITDFTAKYDECFCREDADSNFSKQKDLYTCICCVEIRWCALDPCERTYEDSDVIPPVWYGINPNQGESQVNKEESEPPAKKACN